MTITGEITEICLKAYSSTVPVTAIGLLNQVWKETSILMHCPEHHFLVPAVLLCVYGKINGDPMERFSQNLEIAQERAKQVPGGFCGWWGSCGAAVGAGVFLSIFTDTNPHSTNTWGQVNLITSKCLENIGKLGGPRCCKRVSFTSVLTTAQYMKENFNLVSCEPEEVRCDYSDLNVDCIKERCPYHQSTLEKQSK